MGANLLIFVMAAGLATAPMQVFERRVSNYAKLHRKLEAQLPRLKPTDSPEAIANHQKELAARIQAARASAKPNEIFSPEISAEFRRLLANVLRGQDAKQVRQSLQHAEPVRLALRVNDLYPADLPLQSMPPTLLLQLPKLPRELDYRIAGHSLVLRDTTANLIVDFIPDAMP